MSAGKSISVRVNDNTRTFSAPLSVLEVLRELGLAERKGIAVAINEGVVPRSQWAGRALADGEHLLVIQATQGG